jgi:cyanophycinase
MRILNTPRLGFVSLALATTPLFAAGSLPFGEAATPQSPLAAALSPLPPVLGRLVIVGGALEADNAAVFTALTERLGPTGRVAIIPAASGSPASSAASFTETLGRYGVPADQVDVVKLAVRDDTGTPDVDESQWRTNATDPAEIAKIQGASLVWMTGGDQARLMEVLSTPTGEDTPLLAALRARWSLGATVGGSSAGAAVMSATMIARGDSLAALLDPVMHGNATESQMDGGQLALAPGLGFLPVGVVDQHFDRKARLGRLTRALAEVAPAQRIGYGIDENTALLVDLPAGMVQALGVGSVTVLDARQARTRLSSNRFEISGVALSLINAGDRMRLADLAVLPMADKKPLDLAEGYYTHDAQSGAGMALPNPGLEEALGVELVDNAASDRLERISFRMDGRGVRYVFTEGPDTTAAYGPDADGNNRYAVGQVTFSIAPVRVSVRSASR